MPAALTLSLFVLVGNPLIVLAIMGVMGYRKRTGFLAGLTVAQISEFSIIFIAMGVALGHVDPAALGLVTLVGLVTITLSTYMILYSHRLYALFEPWLGFFERRDPWREKEYDESPVTADVIVFGMGRYGQRLGERLCASGLKVIGVDFDPEVLAKAARGSVQVLFGDAEDEEFVGNLPLDRARWVVSGLRDATLDHQLVSSLRRHGYEGPISATASTAADVPRIEKAGATEVLLPFHDAADYAAHRIIAALELARGREAAGSGGIAGPASGNQEPA